MASNLVPGQTTLAQVRLNAKQEANMVNDPTVNDSEWDYYITNALTRLYAIMIQRFGENYAQTFYEFTTDGSTSRWPLPPDLFKLSDVTVQMFGQGNVRRPVKRINLVDVWKYDLPSPMVAAPTWDPKYTLIDKDLWLLPRFMQGWPVRMIYVPRPQLPSDTGTITLLGMNTGAPQDSFELFINIQLPNGQNFSVSACLGLDFAAGATDALTAANMAAYLSSAYFAPYFTAAASGAVVTLTMQQGMGLSWVVVAGPPPSTVTLDPQPIPVPSNPSVQMSGLRLSSTVAGDTASVAGTTFTARLSAALPTDFQIGIVNAEAAGGWGAGYGAMNFVGSLGTTAATFTDDEYKNNYFIDVTGAAFPIASNTAHTITVTGSPSASNATSFICSDNLTAQNLATAIQGVLGGFYAGVGVPGATIGSLAVSGVVLAGGILQSPTAQVEISGIPGQTFAVAGSANIGAGTLFAAPWSNLIDSINGWEELLVVEAVIRALAKGDDPGNTVTTIFMPRRADLLKEIEDQASNRDAGSPMAVSDSMGLDSYEGYGPGGSINGPW